MGIEMGYASKTLKGKGWTDGDEYHIHYPSFAPKKPIPNKRGKGSSRRKLVRLLLLQNGLCFYCGKLAPAEESNVDHVVPLSAGGSKRFNNLVASHRTCNTLKDNRLPTANELERLKQLHKDFKE